MDRDSSSRNIHTTDRINTEGRVTVTTMMPTHNPLLPPYTSNITKPTLFMSSSEPGNNTTVPVYEISVAVALVVAWLTVMVFLTRLCIKKMKRKQLEKEFTMTPLDANLSSQFLTDFPDNGKLLRAASFDFPTPKCSHSVVIHSVSPPSPIPSEICVTSPTGETRKSIWQIKEQKLEKQSRKKPKKSMKKVSSLPTLASKGSSSDERGKLRREAIIVMSDDDDTNKNLKDLKKKYKKDKKRCWKK